MCNIIGGKLRIGISMLLRIEALSEMKMRSQKPLRFCTIPSRKYLQRDFCPQSCSLVIIYIKICLNLFSQTKVLLSGQRLFRVANNVSDVSGILHLTGDKKK